MVQVLPYVPSFGDKLAETLGSAIGNIGEAYYKRKGQEALQQKDSALLQQLNDPNLTPAQRVALIGKMSPETQKTTSTLLGPLLREQEKGAQKRQLLGGIGNLPGFDQMQSQGPPSAQSAQNLGAQPSTKPASKVFPHYSDEDLYRMTLAPETKPFAENVLEQRRHEEKILHEEELEKRKEDAKIRAEERALGNKKAEKYLEQVETDRVKIPEEELSLETIREAVNSGELDPFSKAHMGEIFSSLGAPDALVRLFQTPESQAFKTSLKTFIGNTVKDSFRGTTNTAELKLVEDMLAKIGTSREANLAAVFALQAAQEMKKLRLSITDQYLEAGVSPSKVAAVAEKALEPLRRQIKDEYFEALRELSGGSGGK